MPTLGIIGGGQLARMLVLDAARLGINCLVLDPTPDAGAGQMCPQIVADYDDVEGLRKLDRAADALTFDFENVPARALEALDAGEKLSPGIEILHVAQDRLHEKNLCRELDIDVGDFYPVDSRADLAVAIEQTGYPALLKTRRLGYDGKGQVLLRQPEDLERAWHRLGDQALILEAFIDFDWECSIIGVGGRDGEIRSYPLTRNHHDQGILVLSRAPLARIDPGLQQRAEHYLQRIMRRFNYVGVMALELFVCGKRLLANEIAPRVHNSGHWSIDAAECSQFENHVRACMGLPPGPVNACAEALMLNWIGKLPDPRKLLAVPGLHWHDYGKKPRPGRKLGHATLCGRDREQLAERAARLQALHPWPGLEQFIDL